MTAYNGFWCDRCPTRIALATESDEVSCDAFIGEPCPLCDAGKLESWDTLIAYNAIPYTDAESPLGKTDAEVHARYVSGAYDRDEVRVFNKAMRQKRRL